ncbi:hypothetical protein [Brucella pseudogrignonensis]|uniref:hypothetical protein n=1 Tax=Brucella pseudogrignonensis TaxID=419475 RepID=UPI003ECE8BAB
MRESLKPGDNTASADSATSTKQSEKFPLKSRFTDLIMGPSLYLQERKAVQGNVTRSWLVRHEQGLHLLSGHD